MKLQTAVKTSLIFAAAAIAGCAHQGARNAGKANPADASRTITADAETASRPATMISVPELKTVYFDYDSDVLKAQARSTLKANAAWLKDHADIRVQITGNCDQRGTVEYNLALGERRADAVRDYYARLGVEAARISTISYGKERLACSDSTDQCWKMNRRAETLEAVSQNVSSRENSVSRP